MIRSRPLNGGYVLFNYKIDTKDWGVVLPYFRWQQYTGGYLWERNSPDTFLNEFDLGASPIAIDSSAVMPRRACRRSSSDTRA